MIRLERPNGLRIELCETGASWLSAQLPMPDGRRRELLLALDTPLPEAAQRAFVGSVVGRYANRIAGAQVQIAGQRHALAANEGNTCLHGGPDGWSRRPWQVTARDAVSATLALHSPEGDQGFPGAVDAQVRYRLGEDGRSLAIDFEARSTRTTPLALTHHAYLNLDGAPTDVPTDVPTDARQHRLQLASDQLVPIDAQMIPVAPDQATAGTDLDFRSPRRIADHWLASEQQARAQGIDHAFLLDPAVRSAERPAAQLWSGDGRVHAALYTDQPALQVYTGQHLRAVPGRGGAVWGACTALALEPGLPPDACNHPEWPCHAQAFTAPGQVWRAHLRWVFQPLCP